MSVSCGIPFHSLVRDKTMCVQATPLQTLPRVLGVVAFSPNVDPSADGISLCPMARYSRASSGDLWWFHRAGQLSSITTPLSLPFLKEEAERL